MIRSRIYDALIIGLTSKWYAAVIDRLPHGASMLDVGIGTAGALVANADRIREKRIRVSGVDIDGDYIERAKERVETSGLGDHVQVNLESVYDHQGGPYDAVYFSASFMLLPDPEGALSHCVSLLKPDGRLYFTQTIQTRRSSVMEWFKPLLKRLSSIDFGRVTYEQDFKDQIQAAGLELEAFTTLGRHGKRAYCLAVARPCQ
jgi:ubiquinone/menaquinone biosynthesis C-methylase UbiE